MNEIKEIAKINLKYNDYSEPKFLFINTYDNSLYVGDETKGGNLYGIPELTDIVLNEEPPYFEDDAEFVEEIKVPYNKMDETDFKAELIFLIPSLNIRIKTFYSYQDYGGLEGIMQGFGFKDAINISGGIK
ncbi:hypothetical protein [Staphylococcus shinii]|uniref:hypothetical protein n=1 Tax=Staphylococcus shinii TaxID=2912228 RepID=UPI002972C205|nr:hypothetical protein [Staphylococcus saprophyticus]